MEKNNLITPDHEQLARFAKALGHPVRAFIIELLSTQSCCFSGDLAEDLPIARSTLSQHLKELKDAGLIQGTIEYPKIRYCIDRGNWEKAKTLFSNLLSNQPTNEKTCK
jgi:ArsR family transcriptional regulator